MSRTITEIKNDIHNMEGTLRELRQELNDVEIKEYLGLRGKFVTFEEGGATWYMLVYSVFRSGEGVIVRGSAFMYEESEWWDGSRFVWHTDWDTEIRDIHNTFYEFKVITREEYEKRFGDYLYLARNHFKKVTDVAVEHWVNM